MGAATWLWLRCRGRHISAVPYCRGVLPSYREQTVMHDPCASLGTLNVFDLSVHGNKVPSCRCCMRSRYVLTWVTADYPATWTSITQPVPETHVRCRQSSKIDFNSSS